MSNHSFGKEFLKISRIFLNAHSEKEKERKIIGHYPSNHIPTHKCFYVLLVSEKGKMKVKRRKASCCGLCKWHGRRGDPLPVWTTVMTGDMREDQQAFQVLKGELMQLLAVGNCTIFGSQLHCSLSFTFTRQRVHAYLWEMLTLPLKSSYFILFLL